MRVMLSAAVFMVVAIVLWRLVSRATRSRIALHSGGFGQEDHWARAPEPLIMGGGGPRVLRWMTSIRDFFAASNSPGLSKASPAPPGPVDIRNVHPVPAPRGAREKHWLAEMATGRAFQWVAAAHRRSGARNGMQQRHASPSRIPKWWFGQDSVRNLWELLPLGMLVLNDKDEILKVNTRTEQLFGFEPGELVGEAMSRLVPELGPAGKSTYRDASSSSSQSIPSASVRSLIGRRKDGSEFPAEIGFRPYSLRNVAAILTFVEDKSDHYELLKIRRDLVHVTRVSTMGELAGSLAHELNQPLTAILSNVQAAQRFMAADPIDVEEVREILNDIVQDDYRAGEVIRRIRAVVKKGNMECTSLDLATVISDVIFMLHSDAIMRETRVTLEACDGLPAVYADKVQLQQVALNLLLNAFDAMSRVLPCDRVVSIALTQEGDDMVRIAVRDRGHGLTIGDLDTIFKPFYTSKPHGLGLGLSISRSIVDLHGGRLWAENNIDRGATFYVTLPTCNAAAQKQSR